MFARHVTLALKPGCLDEAARIFAGSALPLLRQQPGFVEACMLGDDDHGTGFIIIFWQQAADSLNLDRQGFYAAQIAKFSHVILCAPVPALLQVPVSTFGVAAGAVSMAGRRVLP